MKNGSAERMPPLQGSLSFSRLPTTLWWDSLRSVMAQAMTYHSPPRHPTPARAARAGDPGSTPALGLGSISEGRVCEHWNSTMAETTFDLSKTNPA